MRAIPSRMRHASCMYGGPPAPGLSMNPIFRGELYSHCVQYSVAIHGQLRDRGREVWTGVSESEEESQGASHLAKKMHSITLSMILNVCLQGMGWIHTMKSKPHKPYCDFTLPPIISSTRKNRTNPHIPKSPTFPIRVMRGDSIQ